MGGNICKWGNQHGINFQNIQTAHRTQYQNSKQPNQKLGGRSEYIFLKKKKKRHTDGQKAHEKMFNITNT